MKKKKKRYIILLVILLVLAGVVYMVIFGSKGRRTGQVKTTQIPYSEDADSRILVAYFTGADNMPQDGLDAVTSASVMENDGELVGNTEYAAMKIGQLVGADTFSIQTNRLYSQNYTLSTIQALGEQTLNVKPALVSHVNDFEQYDVIFLGYPAWWMDIPIAVESFLDEYDFSGKTVIPFTTHVSSGLGDTVEKIQKLVPGAEVQQGIAIKEDELEGEQLNDILIKQLKEYGIFEI